MAELSERISDERLAEFKREWDQREQERVSRHVESRLKWTSGLLKCHDCGGYQSYEYLDNGDLQIRHSCHAGKQVTEQMTQARALIAQQQEALKAVRGELCTIAQRVSTHSSEAAMNCIGIAMTTVDSVMARVQPNVGKHENIEWGTNCLSSPDRGPHECAGDNETCVRNKRHVCCRCGAFCLCLHCNEGNPRTQSSVSESLVHTDTPVGRVKCIDPPHAIAAADQFLRGKQ